MADIPIGDGDSSGSADPINPGTPSEGDHDQPKPSEDSSSTHGREHRDSDDAKPKSRREARESHQDNGVLDDPEAKKSADHLISETTGDRDSSEAPVQEGEKPEKTKASENLLGEDYVEEHGNKGKAHLQDALEEVNKSAASPIPSLPLPSAESSAEVKPKDQDKDEKTPPVLSDGDIDGGASSKTDSEDPFASLTQPNNQESAPESKVADNLVPQEPKVASTAPAGSPEAETSPEERIADSAESGEPVAQVEKNAQPQDPFDKLRKDGGKEFQESIKDEGALTDGKIDPSKAVKQGSNPLPAVEGIVNKLPEPKHTRGVSEADTKEEAAARDAKDATKAALGIAEIGTVVVSAGAGSGAVAGAEAGASGAAAAGVEAGAVGAAAKSAGSAAAGTGAKASAEAAAESAGKEALASGAEAEASQGFQSLSKNAQAEAKQAEQADGLVEETTSTPKDSAASKSIDGSSEAGAGKTRGQKLEDAKKKYDEAQKAKKTLDKIKNVKGSDAEKEVNKALAHEKNEQGWLQDNRSQREKRADRHMERTGVDRRESTVRGIGAVPIAGPLLARVFKPAMDIQQRHERLAVRRRQNVILAGGLIAIAVFLGSLTAGVGGGGAEDVPGGTIVPAPVGGTNPCYSDVPEGEGEGSWSGEQVGNATIIVGVTKEYLKADSFTDANRKRAASIALSTAIVESTLVNLDHGDRDSVGLFQQRPSMGWGTIDEIMDPAYSSSAFLRALFRLDWLNPDNKPGDLAQDVQISGLPDRYNEEMGKANALLDAIWEDSDPVSLPSGFTPLDSPEDPGGEEGEEGEGEEGSGEECGSLEVGADKQKLAEQIVASGGATYLDARDGQQIADIANDNVRTNCDVNLGVLQIIAISIEKYDSIGISSINRLCKEQYLGNPTSRHWVEGGGHAIDVITIGGDSVVGSGPGTEKLLTLVGPHLPAGSGIGQINCRSNPYHYPGVIYFNDSCNHQHIDIPPALKDVGLNDVSGSEDEEKEGEGEGEDPENVEAASVFTRPEQEI